jgi:hypothetical protein
MNTSRWVINTKATKHMTGIHEVFSDLNTGVWGTVRFDDCSVVRIEGCGTVIFNTFLGIYFIPKLKTNILSIGQLDEIGYKIFIK